MDNIELIELGTVGVIFFFAIKEFFSYLKSRKNKENGVNSQKILSELKLTNSNHLQHLNDCINENNSRLVQTIHEDNERIIEILSRIDGKLSK